MQAAERQAGAIVKEAPQESPMTQMSQAKILFIATDGFEQSELFDPRKAVLDAGAQVTLASIKTDPIQGMKHDQKGDTITPDKSLDAINAADFDALVIPGGVANPDTLRMEDSALQIIQAFMAASKPVAAICHGPWLLAEADVLKDRKVTSWPSIRTDLKNAGAEVVDQEVVVDGNLITSRKPDDIPAFNAALIAAVEAA
jgi:protease I